MRTQRGFSLVELSIVLIVVGVLTSVALSPMKAAIERSQQHATRESLESAREALIGHVVATGVLPCPVASNVVALAAGRPNAVTGDGERCSTERGYLPAAALGLVGPARANGLPADAWGHALRYSVSLFSHDTLGDPTAPDWTTPGEISAVGLAELRADLTLCSRAVPGQCPMSALRSDQIAAVVWSAGADIGERGIQSENADDDTVFAVAEYSQVDNTAFDDQILWLSRSELSYWLLRSNWVP